MHAISAVFQLTSPGIFQTWSASRIFLSFSNTASNLRWLQLPPAAQKSSLSSPRKRPHPFLIIQSHVFSLRTRDPLLCSQRQPSRRPPLLFRFLGAKQLFCMADWIRVLSWLLTFQVTHKMIGGFQSWSREASKEEPRDEIRLMKQHNSQHTSE